MPDTHCEALVRAADKDRFLATLFAPVEHRAALFALYAFNLEIARVREVVREPLAGEIRLQWWSDALAAEGRGEVAAHPVAAPLLAAIARYRLPLEPLEALIAAHRRDLYDEPMATLAELENYAENVSCNLIVLAGQILAAGNAPDFAALAHHAGLAYAITGLLKALPIHAARGQLYLPVELLQRHGASREDIARRRSTPQLRAALADLRRNARMHLHAARPLIATAGSAVVPALLPLAPAGLILARMGRSDYDPFVPVEVPQWRRQWLIWRAAMQPTRMFA
jgi:15-cis-phytoene synthase